jgi:hypothetical protein
MTGVEQAVGVGGRGKIEACVSKHGSPAFRIGFVGLCSVGGELA